MSRLRMASATGDAGAYAILYAVLMVTLLGIAALVLDVSGVRADRRTAKAASDAGAIAGADALGLTSPNAKLACKRAVAFAASSLGTTAGDGDCSGFPATCNLGTSMISKAFPAAAGGWTIEVFWPVSNTSGLMLEPSVERWGPPVTQPIAPADGSPCSRVGTRVYRTRPLVLGSGLGLGTNTARRSQDSVALAEIRPGTGTLVSPLLVLDPKSCNALNSTGNGGVIIKTNGLTPGVIAVDSDGTGGDISCAGGKKTITVTNNSKIWAEDSVGGAKALILSYALPDNLSNAYDPVQTDSGCQASPGVFNPAFPLCPKPTASGARITRAPFDDRYNCLTGCSPGQGDYINQFKRYVGLDPTTGTYTPGPAMGALAATDACTTVAPTYSGSPATPIFLNCTSGSRTITVAGTTTIDGGGGKLRIDADKLTVSGTLVIKNAQVNLNVDTLNVTGCLILNPPDVGTAETFAETCFKDTPKQTVNGYLTSRDMPPMWVRGEIDVGAGGSFVARQTFILQPKKQAPLAGHLKISTTGGRVYWSAPFGKDATPMATCVPATGPSSAPSIGCFEDLALWNEWDGSFNDPDVLGGQSQVFVDGTYFVPDAGFTFGGGAGQSQTRAQFVAKRLNLNGGGTLTMTPDADRSTLLPIVRGSLIR